MTPEEICRKLGALVINLKAIERDVWLVKWHLEELMDKMDTLQAHEKEEDT